MHPHTALFQTLADSAGRAATGLVAAASIQWQPGARLRGAAESKSQGVVSDPTFGVVSDARRLQVRAAVIAAERDLARASLVLDARAAELAEAIRAWENDA